MKALIVVDAQYDFMPGGALAVEDGDQIVPVINELLTKYKLVIFTKDWHPKGMDAFASSHEGKNPLDTYTNSKGVEDTLWPDHCVIGTRGADIHEGIDVGLISGDFYIFKKGMDKECHPYSGFGAEGLEEFLKEKGVNEVDIVGLATDFCVKDTAVDAANKGFKTNVFIEGTRGIAKDLTDAVLEMTQSGARVTSMN